MDKIPTWEEFKSAQYQLLTYGYMLDSDVEGVEFTKLHVKAALEAAAENAQAKENPSDYGTGEIWVDKKSILNAYPLKNIK